MLCAVFAHPDDETFAIGGTVVLSARAGIDCHLYCATDGDAGRVSGVALRSGESLGTVRRRELEAATRVLGFSSVRSGGHPDGALASIDADLLIGEIVDVIRQHRPRVVITFGPEGAPNAHRDHRAISRAATAAFFLARVATAYPEQLASGRAPHTPARLFYVAWNPPQPGDDLHVHSLEPTACIPIRHVHDLKRDAFEAHRTQHEHRARFEQLGLTENECYALAAGVPQPRPVIGDLFEGL